MGYVSSLKCISFSKRTQLDGNTPPFSNRKYIRRASLAGADAAAAKLPSDAEEDEHQLELGDVEEERAGRRFFFLQKADMIYIYMI